MTTGTQPQSVSAEAWRRLADVPGPPSVPDRAARPADDGQARAAAAWQGLAAAPSPAPEYAALCELSDERVDRFVGWLAEDLEEVPNAEQARQGIRAFVDSFNADLRKQVPKPALLREIATGYRDLIGARTFPLTGSAEQFSRRFAVLNALAKYYDRLTRRTFNALLAVAAVAMLFFEYSHLFHDYHWLRGVTAVSLAAAFLVEWLLVRKFDWHDKHLDYRALAEALRVQFWWEMTGVQSRVESAYLPSQKGRIAALCYALYGWNNKPGEAGQTAPAGSNSGPAGSVADKVASYIEDNLAYYHDRIAEDKETMTVLEKVGRWGLAVWLTVVLGSAVALLPKPAVPAWVIVAGGALIVTAFIAWIYAGGIWNRSAANHADGFEERHKDSAWWSAYRQLLWLAFACFIVLMFWKPEDHEHNGPEGPAAAVVHEHNGLEGQAVAAAAVSVFFLGIVPYFCRAFLEVFWHVLLWPMLAAVLVICLGGQEGQRAFWKSGHDAAAVLILIGGACCLAYAERRALGEETRSFERMKDIIEATERKLQKVPPNPDEQLDELRRQALRRLGRESLIHNANWLLMHRERPPEARAG